jgi:stage V sporulation protein B
MLIKIVTTRLLGTEGTGIYMLISPTFMLLITIAQLGFPVAISKLVAEDTKNNKNLVFSIIPVSLIINLIIMIILFLISGFISNELLHESRTRLAIISIGFVLPFISISSIIRGYFFGKERMFPHTLSNIVEQLVRLFLTIYFIPNLLKYGLSIAVTGVVLINILSEFSSIIILLIFLPKRKISIKDFKCDKSNIKDILEISIPTTTTRLIGSISFFLEPIILTYVLLKVGYSNTFITTEYGIINGYVYPLLLLPSFFTMAISNALLPVISHSYSIKDYKYTKYKIKQAITLSLLIGLPATIIFMIYPEILLKFIYHTNEGITYIKIIAPFFILHYIQSPLTSALQAMNKAKTAMNGTLIGSVIRTILLFIISYLKVGLWGLVIASISNIVYITLHHIYYVRKYLKEED